jgi:NADH dehydrogenase FAD-containing subunit
MNDDNRTEGAVSSVLVVGAGYAGLIATNRLLGSLTHSERSRVEVTVVNPRDDFVERIRLHQLAAGSRTSVTRPLKDLLHPEAGLIRGSVTLLDATSRVARVGTDAGEVELGWDYLMYAVGSVAAAPIPGAREHAFLLADVEAAVKAADAVQQAGDRSRILVVGGGFTGVEAAAELAEQHPSAEVLILSTGRLLPTMRAQAYASIARTLRTLGVEMMENARVQEIADGKALLADGETISFDVCVLAASFDVPNLAEVSGLAVDRIGRLRVDETLRSIDAPRIIGAGDAVAVPQEVGAHLRMACAVALPLGGHAAEVLLAELRGTQPQPFSMKFTAQCLSLGRKRGYIQLVHPDDSPRIAHIGGRVGAKVKEAVCRNAVDAPTRESTVPGSYSWRTSRTRRAPSTSATAQRPTPLALTSQAAPGLNEEQQR